MKIAVVGCGALGSFYGARLSHAGEEVWFLLRSDYEAVRRRGVRVHSFEGGMHVNPKCARQPSDIGVADLVIIGLKSTANQAFAELLTPLVGPQTILLTLQNGLGNEEQLAALFQRDQIMGGLCFVCLNRTAPGEIQHTAHGQIILGEFDRWPEPRTHDIRDLFKRAAVPCKVTDSLERTHWEKLVWNIPFNGLGVASAAGLEACRSGIIHNLETLQPCRTTDQLLMDPAWEELVRELMREVITGARAQGLDLPDELEEKQVTRTREMGAYRASTLVDYERGQALELESIFLEPLRRANRAGVPAPRLTALCRVLRALDPGAALRPAGS